MFALLHLLLQATHKGAALHSLVGECLDLVEKDLTVDDKVALYTINLTSGYRVQCSNEHQIKTLKIPNVILTHGSNHNQVQ